MTYDTNLNSSFSKAELFTSALEASTGRTPDTAFSDPMDSMDVLDALSDILLTSHPDRGFNILARTGILRQLLPEVYALKGFGDGIRHKDVWLHTMQVVRQTPPVLIIRWAALFHDIGKVSTRRFTPDGQVTFTGHPETGARMFDKIAGRLPFPEHAAQSIRFLTAAHLRGSAYTADWTDSAVRRFAKDAGDDLPALLTLARADITSKYPEKVLKGLRQINSFAVRINQVLKEDAKPALLPKGLGTELIARAGAVPGPDLGRLMKKLAALVENGTIPSGSPPDTFIEYLNSGRLKPAT